MARDPMTNARYPWQNEPPALPPAPPRPPEIHNRRMPCPHCGLRLLVRHCWLMFHYHHEGCTSWTCVGCHTRVDGDRSWVPGVDAPLLSPFPVGS